ncbi:hypothetical protein GDO81_004715 [Engystomops pustulosus]|uniref:Uncharacterized protein n=1 Tax=Engystomops pustulosus TaxID=76066 RepID=A0AAV7CJ04_ENGPU|nr:hypothetical protein GDO81_004715 [Engystomops pustulosus]
MHCGSFHHFETVLWGDQTLSILVILPAIYFLLFIPCEQHSCFTIKQTSEYPNPHCSVVNLLEQ